MVWKCSASSNLTNPQFRLIKRIDGLIVPALHSPMTRPCTDCSDVNLISFFLREESDIDCQSKLFQLSWGLLLTSSWKTNVFCVLRCFLLYQFVTKYKSNIWLKAEPGTPSRNTLDQIYVLPHLEFQCMFSVITNKFTVRYHLISGKFVIMWYC